MSANRMLVTVTRSFIGIPFARTAPESRTPTRPSARLPQHRRSPINTVTANRVGRGRFWRKIRKLMAMSNGIVGDGATQLPARIRRRRENGMLAADGGLPA
jgi:hypothetical protein